MISIKAKQVAGVTLIVGLAVVSLSVWYISSLVRVRLAETQARAEFVANTVYQVLHSVVAEAADPAQAIQSDPALRLILEAAIFSDTVLYAAIVDSQGVILASNDPLGVGKAAPAADDLGRLLELSAPAQTRAIYFQSAEAYEFRLPLQINVVDPVRGPQATPLEVRIGISTLLIREQFTKEMRTPVITAAAAILVALLVSTVLAQITLRPIHVIRSGLARLGRGELDVSVDLPSDAEMTGLEDSFKAVSARLAAGRTELEGQRATLESVVQKLEDAVALVSTNGTVLFANAAMRPMIGGGNITTLLPSGHPYRVAVERVLERRDSLEPQSAALPDGDERLILAHPFENPDGEVMGVMLVARNLTYLSQLESTISYSRKLAALGRLSAGIAHEVKNPLNATMIHLELLKMKLGDVPDALEHLSVIAAQVRRLDEVVQGFLKFTRPEDLKLQPVSLAPLLDEIRPVIDVEAGPKKVELRVEVSQDLPAVYADKGLLQQAFLNLALNAVQAMPDGGRLRIAANRIKQHRIEILFQDTGIGISPEHLEKIFDLYFTTRERGSGIGLSLVYRTIQLHDGEIEVQSTPGRGTTFRIVLREAPEPARTRRDPEILGLRNRGTLEADETISAS